MASTKENEGESDNTEDESDDEENKQARSRNEWTVEDDEELRKRVSLHGKGNWKAILDNSCIFQEQYKMARFN